MKGRFIEFNKKKLLIIIIIIQISFFQFVFGVFGFVVQRNIIVLFVNKNFSCNSIDNFLGLYIESLIVFGFWDVKCLKIRVWNLMLIFEFYYL